MKVYIFPPIFLIALLYVGLSSLLRPIDSVLIESLESKTKEAGNIYNKIKLIQKNGRDIWMMKQSHQGLVGEKSWDRLAIVVDKEVKPYQARFYQLESGPLEWTGKEKEVPYKVSCFLCHSNGPRAIRASTTSTVVPLSIQEKLRILTWNFKIKSYGRVVADPIHKKRDKSIQPPFRYAGKLENDSLNVKACAFCHRDQGAFARGTLKRQHGLAIQFMVENGYMPPLGFSLSESDRAEVFRFIQGF